MKQKIAFILVLLALLLPVTAAAAEAQWQLSEDEYSLTHNGVEYHRYSLNPADLFMPESIYVLDESGAVKTDENRYWIVQSGNSEHIVAVSDEEYWYGYYQYLYVTEEGKAILDRFAEGDYETLLLTDQYRMETTELTAEQLEKLDGMEPNQTVDVTELAKADYYEIIGLDETGTMGHIHGAVYTTSHSWYYINYDVLDNSYFDSEGAFSFRSGTVEAVELQDEDARMVALLMDEMEIRYEDISYESATIDIEPDAANATGLFWTLTVILGVILPAVPLTFGLVYALKGKCLYPKRWYLLVVLSAAWMLVMGAIVLLIIK